MDKKTVIGLLLIVGIMAGWYIIMMPSKEEREKQRKRQIEVRDSITQANREQFIQDSLAIVESQKKDSQKITEELQKDSAFALLPDSLQQHKLDSVEKIKSTQLFGAFSNHGNGTDQTTVVETDKLILTFLNRGAQLYSAKLKGYHSYQKRFVEKTDDTLDLMAGNESRFALTFFTQGKSINTDQLYFEPSDESVKISGDETKTVTFRAFANGDQNKYIEYSYTIPGNSFLIDFNIRMQGLETTLDAGQDAIPLTWDLTAPRQEQRLDNERTSSKIFYQTTDKELYRIEKKDKKIDRQLKWISYKQKFFSTVLIAKEGFNDQPFLMKVDKYNKENTKYNTAFSSELAIPFGYGPSEDFAMQMYLGPNHFNTLRKLDLGLEKQIELGPFFLIRWINRYLVIPVFNLFQNMGLRYGLIILLLTLIIKLITSPVTYRTFKSSAKMRILKPDIDALNEKFKQGEELQKQQAVMQLYKRAGVSPLAGCIPALLQMPILLAMFSFFPAAFELRQQGFLWAEDFSTYDSILHLPFSIPFYGDHVSLFTLLMTATTLIYTSMTSGQMTGGNGLQAKQMKIMMYMMPIIFLGVLNSYSAALSYYYFLSNLISILMILVIRNFLVDQEKLRLVIEENKKRPVKKSKWSQRLEDMQKIREEQVRQQRNGGNKNAPSSNKGKGKK